MSFLSPVWIWLYVGAFLMLAELISPGFVMFFFGLAAVTVSVLMWIFPSLPLWGQLAAFSVLSIFYLLVLSRYIKSVFMGAKDESPSIDNEYVGRVGRVVAEIRPEVPGRILLGDAEWAAQAATRLETGTEVWVVAQENLALRVEPI